MKTKEINLNQMNLIPLTDEELINENGGGFWDHVAGWVIGKVLDYANEHKAEIQSAWQEGVKANQNAGTGNWVPVGAGF